MTSGDSIWLYTDGLFEPAAVGTHTSGRDWFIETLRGTHADDLNSWVASLLATAERAAAGSPTDDDMALLAAARV
jgi:serine phosphatase RsbU (regulator of sigma subunit)